jgi:hypothetical protein
MTGLLATLQNRGQQAASPVTQPQSRPPVALNIAGGLDSCDLSLRVCDAGKLKTVSYALVVEWDGVSSQ